jgi:hypothetical protein
MATIIYSLGHEQIQKPGLSKYQEQTSKCIFAVLKSAQSKRPMKGMLALAATAS